jgi:hypothetical protein
MAKYPGYISAKFVSQVRQERRKKKEDQGSMRGSEGKIQDKVLAYARKMGLQYKKNEVGRYLISSGWPDVIFFPGMGQCFFMEFKAPGKGLTELQYHKRKELEKAGYKFFVVDSAELGIKILVREFMLVQESK